MFGYGFCGVKNHLQHDISTPASQQRCFCSTSVTFINASSHKEKLFDDSFHDMSVCNYFTNFTYIFFLLQRCHRTFDFGRILWAWNCCIWHPDNTLRFVWSGWWSYMLTFVVSPELFPNTQLIIPSYRRRTMVRGPCSFMTGYIMML
jgi:hypothetical protein